MRECEGMSVGLCVFTCICTCELCVCVSACCVCVSMYVRVGPGSVWCACYCVFVCPEIYFRSMFKGCCVLSVLDARCWMCEGVYGRRMRVREGAYSVVPEANAGMRA